MNKAVLATVLVALTALAGAGYYMQGSNKLRSTPTPGMFDAWSHWKNTYGKTYATPTEEAYRMACFFANYVRIHLHNIGGHSYKLGMNQFGDIPKEEFVALNKGSIMQSTLPKRYKSISANAVPSSVDWRAKGAVTPVKNQNQCGSCWAFSSTGSLEGLHFLTTGTLTSFSEEDLVQCSASYGNDGCNGGLMDQAFQFVEAHGIATEAAYPYTSGDGTTGTCNAAKEKAFVFKNTGYTDVPANSSSALIAALAQQPVSVAIDASGDGFQFYTTGVYNDPSCGTSLDHGVLAVGYDNSGSAPYYIVKNSWDTTWGDNGYIEMAIVDGPGTCGIQMSASYPTA